MGFIIGNWLREWRAGRRRRGRKYTRGGGREHGIRFPRKERKKKRKNQPDIRKMKAREVIKLADRDLPQMPAGAVTGHDSDGNRIFRNFKERGGRAIMKEICDRLEDLRLNQTYEKPPCGGSMPASGYQVGDGLLMATPEAGCYPVAHPYQDLAAALALPGYLDLDTATTAVLLGVLPADQRPRSNLRREDLVGLVARYLAGLGPGS